MRTKTEEKRQAILDVAASTFAELGFERTSMSEICARLGGSKATLYNYFPSKESLFLEVMFQASESDFQNTIRALQVSSDNIHATLHRFGERFLTLLYSPNVLSVRRLLVAEGGRANVGERCWNQGPCRTRAVLTDFFEEAMAKGLLRKAPSTLMIYHLQALLEAELMERFVFQHLPQPTAKEIKTCTNHAIDAFFRLYGPEAETSAAR